MSGLLIGLLAYLITVVFITTFLRGVHSRDDDNAIGEEAANWKVVLAELESFNKQEGTEMKEFFSKMKRKKPC